MNPKTCAITGTTGFLGGNLATILKASGWRVIELNRPAFALGQSVDPAVFKDVQALVHCAYDYSQTNWDAISKINVEGTRLLFDAARKAGVDRKILISSFAAFPGCRSLYGKAKLECETIAQDAGAGVIRPGILYGRESQGVIGAMEKWIRTLPVVPLLSADSVLYVCHVDDLCQLIAEFLALEKIPPPLIYAANSVPNSFKDVIRHLQKVHSRCRPLIPVGWRIPWLMVRAMEAANLKPPFRSDSIIGLVDQNCAPDFSTLKSFHASFRNIL